MKPSSFFGILVSALLMLLTAYACFNVELPFYMVPSVVVGVILAFLGGYIILTLVLMIKRGEVPFIYNKDFGDGSG